MRVRPHLYYCDTIYHIPVNETETGEESLPLQYQMQTLESIQHQAALAVTGAWRGTDTKTIYKELLDLYNTWLKLNPKVDLGYDDDLHWVLADMINYDWYNNEGGSGEVIWHLQKHKIVIDGYQNYYGQYEAKEAYKLDGSDPVRKYKDIG